MYGSKNWKEGSPDVECLILIRSVAEVRNNDFFFSCVAFGCLESACAELKGLIHPLPFDVAGDLSQSLEEGKQTLLKLKRF